MTALSVLIYSQQQIHIYLIHNVNISKHIMDTKTDPNLNLNYTAQPKSDSNVPVSHGYDKNLVNAQKQANNWFKTKSAVVPLPESDLDPNLELYQEKMGYWEQLVTHSTTSTTDNYVTTTDITQ